MCVEPVDQLFFATFVCNVEKTINMEKEGFCLTATIHGMMSMSVQLFPSPISVTFNNIKGFMTFIFI